MPLLSLGAAPPEAEAREGAATLQDLSPWLWTALVVAAGGVVVLAGRYLTHLVYRFLSLAKLPEIQVAGALLMIVAVSLAMSMLGLSPALGSFLAGVVLAGSAYRHELEADLGPFKGILLGLFFITVGAGMNLERLAEEPLPIATLVLALLVLKMLVLWPVAALFKLPRRARLLFTLALAQAGEFGFFLLGFAQTVHVLPAEGAQRIGLVIALSMMLTPALFRLHALLERRLGRGARRDADTIDEHGTVIIAGMGRFGQVVNRMLKGLGHQTVLLDNHPDTVERMRRFGIEAFYGDMGRVDLLAAAGIADAKAVVLAIDDPEKVVDLTAFISRHYPKVKIIARARDRHHVYALHAAGADESVPEVFYSAVRAGRDALVALGHDHAEAEAVADEFVRQDRRMLDELGVLWRPDVPVDENPAYLAKAAEQTAAIEAALRGRVAQAPATEPSERPETAERARG
jgi:CPA2 family monovalent cation:H+ antiporter-2